MMDQDIIRKEEFDFIKEFKANRFKEAKGGFNVHGKLVCYSTTALWMFDSKNFVRIAIVWLIEWRYILII
jgi:hypothetical protein